MQCGVFGSFQEDGNGVKVVLGSVLGRRGATPELPVRSKVRSDPDGAIVWLVQVKLGTAAAAGMQIPLAARRGVEGQFSRPTKRNTG